MVENTHIAHRIAAGLPGAVVLDGRFNVVQMSVAVPKANVAALATVNEFIREAKDNALIAGSISRANLVGVRVAR